MALMPKFQIQNASLYQSAPTSPNGGSSPNNLQFYSAPNSPPKGGGGEDLSSESDDFEFETSKKFGNLMEFEASENFECLLEEQQKQEKPKRERGDSLPTMAFADELFANGLVMPLKPPPRLQSWNDKKCVNTSSIPSSPRSPTSAFKNPFFRRAAWNDDFDPFVVALQKVSEEIRGRSSSAGNKHRRTRSHSPFRSSKSKWCNDSGRWNQGGGHLETIKDSGSHFNMPIELKGSPYARWVLDQTKQGKQLSPKGRTMLKDFTLVKRVRPVKTDPEGYSNNKAIFGKKIGNQDEGISIGGETKMKRIKGILLKYASFGRESTEEKSTNQSSTKWGSSHLKKLSFKMKGNASENGKKRVVVKEPKMAVVEYKRNKPTLVLCFYGIESPRNMK